MRRRPSGSAKPIVVPGAPTVAGATVLGAQLAHAIQAGCHGAPQALQNRGSGATGAGAGSPAATAPPGSPGSGVGPCAMLSMPVDPAPVQAASPLSSFRCLT